jgi:P27 family predicted phage terminase small subunit
MGTPPVPFELKVLRGNPGKRPLRRGPEFEVPAHVPEPPAFMTGYAADEWWRIAPMLYRLRLLTVVDVAALAAYCTACARWRTAAEVLATMAENDPLTGALMIKTRGGDAAQNPLVAIERRAASDMVRYATEFGMTPAARARIAAGPNPPPGGSKFAGLIPGLPDGPQRPH